MIRYGAYAAKQAPTEDAPIAPPIKVTFGPVVGAIPQPVVDLCPRQTALSMIVRDVADWANVSLREIYSPRRARHVARPRQLAMWVATEATNLSIPQIGKHFGRDHTTVLHAVNVIRRLIENGDEIRRIALDLVLKHKRAA